LKYGADPLAKNSHGKTPIDVADDDTILELLNGYFSFLFFFIIIFEMWI